MQIYADLEAEQDALRGLVEGLPAIGWSAASGAGGWSVSDVVLHLAQTEEFVVTAVRAGNVRVDLSVVVDTLDGVMAQLVERERGRSGAEVLARWDAARREALTCLREADQSNAVQWVASPLRPATLATTRLAEHWAHGLDIAAGLGAPYPDTARLRHVAWLAHRSIPYAYGIAGAAAPPAVRFELAGPAGEVWQIGPADAECVVTGSAGELCRIGARRLDPTESGVRVTGPGGERLLELLRNYAA
ncbi:MAG TPA: maleylpyruvate isomerase family mycothiol-dependent enzyme [Mycobacteriales bacterium]|nr:maleylpyruvate isomerase family mycothiol-dependent enzyme [Mycobacteriales bacterium]